MWEISGKITSKLMLKSGLFLIFILTCSVSRLYSQWEDYVAPNIEFIDKDGGSTAGSQIYHDLIPEPETFIQEACLDVCKVLYDSYSEVPVLRDITYSIEDYDGISGKWGSRPHIYISYSTRWIKRTWDNSGGDPAATLYETKGVLYHELVHGYQYDGNHIPSHAIEGIADAVRIALNYIPYSNRSPGGSYTDSYQRTGFFLDWLNQEKFPAYNFLRRFNQTADPKLQTSWSWDVVREMTGQEVSALWGEYQSFLLSPLAASFTFVISDTDRTVEFKDKSISKTPISRRRWDFGDGSTSTQSNPRHTYAEDGDYAVTLTVTTQTSSNQKTHIVPVPQSIPYCQSQSADCTREWINEVSIGNVINPSGSSTYSDYTDLIVELHSQETQPIVLVSGFTGSVYQGGQYKLWIDYDQDRIFNDQEELVFDSGFTEEPVVNGQITVPITSEDIFTRMRVSLKGGDVEILDVTDFGGTVRAQYNDSPHGEEKEKAFDNSDYSKYLTFHNSVWIQFQFEDGNKYPLSSYSITSANDYPERDPRDWQLLGSNNGSSWVTIDTQRSQSFNKRFETKNYVCNNQTPYQYYRFNVLRNKGGNETQFAEIRLFSVASTSQFSCGGFGSGEVEDYSVYITKSAIEGFENGFETLAWEHSGEAFWEITSTEAYTGAHSVKAGAISDGERSVLSVPVDCTAGEISFRVKVSSESKYDKLALHIDNEESGEWSGDQDWKLVSIPVSPGMHTFQWIYSKDGSVSEGEDTAWIDDIAFPF